MKCHQCKEEFLGGFCSSTRKDKGEDVPITELVLGFEGRKETLVKGALLCERCYYSGENAPELAGEEAYMWKRSGEGSRCPGYGGSCGHPAGVLACILDGGCLGDDWIEEGWNGRCAYQI